MKTLLLSFAILFSWIGIIDAQTTSNVPLTLSNQILYTNNKGSVVTSGTGTVGQLVWPRGATTQSTQVFAGGLWVGALLPSGASGTNDTVCSLGYKPQGSDSTDFLSGTIADYRIRTAIGSAKYNIKYKVYLSTDFTADSGLAKKSGFNAWPIRRVNADPVTFCNPGAFISDTVLRKTLPPAYLSDQDAIVVFNDSARNLMNIEVIQRIYSWKGEGDFKNDVTIIHDQIINKSTRTYINPAVGMCYDMDLVDTPNTIGSTGWADQATYYSGDPALNMGYTYDDESVTGNTGIVLLAAGINSYLQTGAGLIKSVRVWSNGSGLDGLRYPAHDAYAAMASGIKDSSTVPSDQRILLTTTAFYNTANSDRSFRPGDTLTTMHAIVIAKPATNTQQKRLDTLVSLAQKVKSYFLANSCTLQPVGVQKVSNEVPSLTELFNYPNPFAKQTTIRYALSEGSDVRLEVFDALGRLVSTLVNTSHQNAGIYEVPFTSGTLHTGAYLYRLTTNTTTITKSFVIAR